MFLKPRRLGSSIGAYAVKNAAEFCEYFPKSSAIGKGLVMAEKLVEDKRELECAYYSANERTLVSPPGEILNTGFYGYEEKYVNFANTSTEADVNDRIKSQINEYSLALADACGLRHLGRIDYFLAGNKLFFNEINTFPGFTAHSLYPKMIQKLGISPGEALRSFIEDAIGC
jgi:D-alanine--D-alanine ligase